MSQAGWSLSAMIERMEPKTLRTWLIVAAIVYFVLPYDFLPDFFGLPGRLDDLGLMAWLAWFYRGHAREFLARRSREEDEGHTRTNDFDPGASTGAGGPTQFDAHEVLGLSPSASPDDVRTAYRSRMQQYHPDKVAHLGEELQKLAHEKTQEIERAYRQLKR